ncbi:hypothetical protein [Solibacillus sp. FSL K6-1523]|uniref:hypothetical protein n=1 Tax=Solibacillus sp. FSL K6-1523 TaxID=2921471 RepID=UPI0030F4DA4B
MKIFSTAPDGNEAAELENTHYFNLAIKKIEESNEWMKKTEKPYQVMLVHIDILLMLSRKYKLDANLSIKKDRVSEWKNTFDEWFIRCGKKIPAKYRNGIKENAVELFNELNGYGH